MNFFTYAGNKNPYPMAQSIHTSHPSCDASMISNNHHNLETSKYSQIMNDESRMGGMKDDLSSIEVSLPVK